MAKQKITFVVADDWEGMYVNGKLVLEGHSLQYEEILRHIGVEFSFEHANEGWLEEIGNLPKNLKDCETHI